MNRYTIFQCAQLLERFSALQRTRFPFYKLEQCVAPESINALVTKKQRAPVFLWSRDHRTREIKSIAAKIENDFHLVGRKSVRRILEWMRSRHDFYFAIRLQFFDKLVDQAWIDQRFIPLDIDYVCELPCFPCHFGCSIGAGAVSRRSQCDLCTPLKRRGGDPHI